MSDGRDPVVTGLGALTPLGLDAPSTWRGLLAGESGVGPITHFDASALPTRIAGEVKGFDPVAHLGGKRAHRTARFSQLAIVAAREAAADAGLDLEAVAERAGVTYGCAVAGTPETERNVQALLEDGPKAVSPFFVASTIPNMAACEVAIDLGLHGPVNASSLACATGTYALMEARRLILAGEADVVVAGGGDAGINPAMFSGLSNMGPLSERNDDPAGASRPFDADRDGFVFGEGSVAMVVESAAHAEARGAVPYGRVAGAALTADAFHMTAPEPSGRYAALAIETALVRAGIAPAELGYVCAHGTGTRANDSAEAKAIRDVLGEATDAVPVSSPKSMVGHLIGAAGSLAAMVCLLSIRDGVVPPTINLDNPDPDCDLDHVANLAREVPVRAAIANAFGFGGQNCVVAITAA
ncbi:MAG: beta-ketoacyl-ACP synthase II [Actinobacteria bacterium]|nr:beta-ketoacyl-ACP synthase II [Actinomycetota bacterium]